MKRKEKSDHKLGDSTQCVADSIKINLQKDSEHASNLVHGTKIQFSPFQDMFAAGSDTTVTTIEWATSELLNDTGELDRAQTEV